VAKLAAALAGASLLIAVTSPSAPATPASADAPHFGVGPVVEVSGTCGGPNAEVEQAAAAPNYVYETWIGCGGEGFARSVDGGLHFQKALMLPDSSNSFDPAIAVAANGTVYASFLRNLNGYAYPVVATSFDHGATFPQVSSLIPPFQGNWGDRDFIAAGPNGTVYVTWDYGPTAAAIRIICDPIGSCSYTAGDVTAVIQKSTDNGKTWSQITPMQPNMPMGGGYDASVQVEPSGRVDALIWGHHITDPVHYTLHPGHEFFTHSDDGGKTWSPMVAVGPQAGAISLYTWWIDGNLGIDSAGNLYATWDTQTATNDIGWLSYSTDHGATWSNPLQVTYDQVKAPHIMEVAGVGPGVADVAWQSSASPLGWGTYLQPFSITKGWLSPPIQVSSQFGDKMVWPGDTFGISVMPSGPLAASLAAADRVALSWGSAIQNNPISEIYAAVVTLPKPLDSGA
jgi:hypothetical protein